MTNINKQINKQWLLPVFLMLLWLLPVVTRAQSDACSSATALTVGAACVNGTTSGSTVEAGETNCDATFNQSVWYKFTATSATHLVTIQSTGSCYIGSAVYTNGCVPTAAQRLTCELAANGPSYQRHSLSGLTIGNVYLIQIIYSSGGACGTEGTFCIDVATGEFTGNGTGLCTGATGSIANFNFGSCHTGTLNGAVPSLGANGCTGNNPKAAFAFRPQGTTAYVTVDNLGTGFLGNVEVTITKNEDCAAMTLVTTQCGTITCPTDELQFSFATTAGTRYYAFISSSSGSNGANSDFSICIGDGAACSASGCGIIPPPVAATNAYGVYAPDGAATVTSCYITGTGGNCGGTACLVCTPTDDAYTSVSINNYPIITAGDATNNYTNCTTTNMNMTTTDATPKWTDLGANSSACAAPCALAVATINTNQYTSNGRRTIGFEGDVTINQPATSYSVSVNGAIPDNSCTGVTSTIAVSGFPCTSVATSGITVTTNISHTYDADLDIFLTAPNGAILELSTDNGSTGDNYTNTVFSDAAAGNITAGTAPFTGSYKPEGTLVASGCAGYTGTVATFGAIGGGTINPNGNWTLFVRDDLGAIVGTLDNWTVTIPATTCATPNQALTYPGFVNIMLAPPSPGTILPVTPVCSGVSATFSSSLGATPGYSYDWTVTNPAGGTSSVTTNTATSTGIVFTNNTAGNLTYTVNLAVSSLCCGLLTPTQTITIVVYPPPAAPTASASPNPVCPGATSVLSATAPASCTFQWYNAATGGTLLSSGTTYSVTPAVNTDYYVQATSASGCPGTRTLVTVTVTPTPAPTVPNVNSCAAGNLTMDVSSPISGATYNWYTGSCGGTLVQSSIATNLTVNIPAIQTNTYYVSVVAPGGCAESSCTTVTAAVTTSPAAVTWLGLGTSGLNNWFDANNWGIPKAATTYTNTVAAAVGTGNCIASSRVDNTITISGYVSTVASSGITVTITAASHGSLDDVNLFLTAPNGQILGLSDNRGSTGACALTNITFSDAAGTANMGTTCPAAGSSFRPEAATFGTGCGTSPITSTITSFGAFGGGNYNPNGVWTLTVADNINNNGGASIAVAGWSIYIPAGYIAGCLPTCASDVTIPATPATAVSNPPDIGFNTAGAAAAKSLSLAAGNTLSFSAGKAVLNVCGDFTHAGNFKTSNATNGFSLGKVVFMGTTAQVYNNSNAPSNSTNFFNNVVLNNTAGTPQLSLSNKNMTLGTGGTFTFQSGKLITLSTDTLVILNTAPTAISGHASTRYVQGAANGAGNLKRYIQASGLGSYDFPVGQTTYENVNINFTTAPTTHLKWLNACFYNWGGAPPTSPAVTECFVTYSMPALDNGYWDIVAYNSNNNTGKYDMTLFNTGYTNASSGWSIMSRHNGSATWAMTNGDGSAGVCVATPVTAVLRQQMNGFSKFGTAQSGVPLPVQLLSFDVYNVSNVADIKWTTANEINCDYFIVEKSTDAIDFFDLAQVDSKAPNGNSTYNINYGIIDNEVSSGNTYYYRLKQYDFNGTAKYSTLESITIGDKGSDVFTVMPNPTNGTAEVFYRCKTTETANLKVYDDRGRLIFTKEVNCTKGQNTTMVDISGHADGIYLIVLSTNSDVYKTKLIKMDTK